MKKALLGVLAFLALPVAAVILPLRIPFQGKLIDPTTNQPRNGALNLTFRLYDAPTAGNLVYTEVHPSVSIVNGVFSVQLGTITLLNANLLSGASAFLTVQVQGDASEMLPRQPLSMSPYAYTAMQLVSHTDIRVNAGLVYSTFTADGDLTLPFGIAAATGAFNAQGNTIYSLFSSSGIYMSSGTLELNAASRGIEAIGTGIVASTGLFTSAANGIYALTVSSGIRMSTGTMTLEASSRGLLAFGTGIVASTGLFRSASNGVFGLEVSSGLRVTSGTLGMNGSGGIHVRYGVVASTFVGNASSMTFTAPDVSNSSGSTAIALVANTEAVMVSTNLAVGVLSQKVHLMGMAVVNRVANAVATCTARFRVNTGGACAIGSTLIYAQSFTVANSASLVVPMPLFALYHPLTMADASYCLTMVCNQAHSVGARSISVQLVAP